MGVYRSTKCQLTALPYQADKLSGVGVPCYMHEAFSNNCPLCGNYC